MFKEKVLRLLKIIVIPVLFALAMRFIFDLKEIDGILRIMTLTFFICLPYAMGVMAMYLSKEEDVKRMSYRILYPWLPILMFLVVTIAVSIEGWVCWIMILPIFLIFGSLGGLTGGYFRSRKSNRANNLHLSFVVFIPFVLGPVENMIHEIPGFYKAYTFIDIKAPKEKIWSNVTRVSEITEAEDQGTLTNIMQIPRPIRAELDFEGVGAKREAIFDGGLIFDEKVNKYEHQRLMQFSIKANTYEIPSTTFDEHILIGGEFFDVLEGTYELEDLGNNTFRLHLSSEFKLTTTFNFYASIWGRWIMKDIQQNILTVIKKRSE